MTLTKAKIADAIHQELGFHKNRSAELLELLLELVKNKLEVGEDVLISGFGKFCVKLKKERRGRKSGDRRGYAAGRPQGDHVPLLPSAPEENQQRASLKKPFALNDPFNDILGVAAPSRIFLRHLHGPESCGQATAP